MREMAATQAIGNVVKTSRQIVAMQCIVLAALMLVLYWSTIGGLVKQWWTDSDYSHGFIVAIFSAYLLWRNRTRWKETEVRPSTAGILWITVAMCTLILGVFGAELFLARVSLVILLGGLLVYFAGWKMLRAVAAPWAVLFLMIPLPVIVFNEIAAAKQFH
jgi:exosortase